MGPRACPVDLWRRGPAPRTTTGGVVVVADSSTIGSSSALPVAVWITARNPPRSTGHALANPGCPGSFDRWHGGSLGKPGVPARAYRAVAATQAGDCRHDPPLC